MPTLSKRVEANSLKAWTFTTTSVAPQKNVRIAKRIATNDLVSTPKRIKKDSALEKGMYVRAKSIFVYLHTKHT